MSNLQLKQSLKDVLPTASEPFPPQLVQVVDSLYSMSLQKHPMLPNKAEIARYHVCAYLAVEKYHRRFNLPEPSIQKIPAQPKAVDKILDDFRNNLLNGLASPTNSPRKMSPQKTILSPKKTTLSPQKTAPSAPTTPTKGRLSPTKSPLKAPTTPRISSPLKRLQTLKDEELDKSASKRQKSALSDVDSPFNPKKSDGTPTPNTPTSSAPGTPSTPRYQKHITIADFISFANNFYIPSTVTPRMVETFLDQRHKFTKKSEWLLACGMIHAAYIRINHKLIAGKMGAKSSFQDQLFQYQKGGLLKWNMNVWINIIEEAVKAEPWILDLEKKFVHGSSAVDDDNGQLLEITAKFGNGWHLVEQFGSMITPDSMFDSTTQNKYYSVWTSKVLAEIDNSPQV